MILSRKVIFWCSVIWIMGCCGVSTSQSLPPLHKGMYDRQSFVLGTLERYDKIIGGPDLFEVKDAETLLGRPLEKSFKVEYGDLFIVPSEMGSTNPKTSPKDWVGKQVLMLIIEYTGGRLSIMERRYGGSLAPLNFYLIDQVRDADFVKQLREFVKLYKLDGHDRYEAFVKKAEDPALTERLRIDAIIDMVHTDELLNGNKK
ncbi:MAG: hypothetical protein ACRD4L_00460, partial [Pyrinomonadaceae bacterium]